MHPELLFFLLAAHALADYALQNETMAVCKCPGADHPVAAGVPWFYWLTAHALLHGAAVGAVVRWVGFDWNVAAGLAVAETAAHWIIDYGKCRRWYGIHVDQGLHVACKLLWWGLLVGGTFAE